jgi:hypothetical protein
LCLAEAMPGLVGSSTLREISREIIQSRMQPENVWLFWVTSSIRMISVLAHFPVLSSDFCCITFSQILYSMKGPPPHLSSIRVVVLHLVASRPISCDQHLNARRAHSRLLATRVLHLVASTDQLRPAPQCKTLSATGLSMFGVSTTHPLATKSQRLPHKYAHVV